MYIFASLQPDTGLFQYLASVYFNFEYDIRFNTKNLPLNHLPLKGDSPIPLLEK